MATVTIGIDIGQRRDPTAIAVAETEWRTAEEDGRRDDYYLIRHLERLPLGTPYPAVAERLAAIVGQVRERGRVQATFVDATGVGQPVVDILKRAKVPVTPVYFTYGDRRTVAEEGYVSLGKGWMVSRLQALLQTGRLLLPRTEEALALTRELETYEIRVTENANDTYGAFSTGSHDDLVTAVGLATQVPPPSPIPLEAALLGGGVRFGGAHDGERGGTTRRVPRGTWPF